MSGLVPVIDLDDAAPEQIDETCRTVGFLSITNHGLPDMVVERMLQATDAFFALPLAEKLKWRPSSKDLDRGYTPQGVDSLAYSLGVDHAPPDLSEAFIIGQESWPSGDPAFEAHRHSFFAPNVWPDHPAVADLRPALLDYYDHVQRLCHRISGVFAEALELPDGFFEAFTDHSTDTLSVNHYERYPGSAPLELGQQRKGAHCDYGLLTVLWADQAPGLQIVGPDGEWHDVVPPPGALLVNLGDLMAQWTNDRWRSTLHRVVPPPAGLEGPMTRRSVAFFHDANHDALVACLPTCCSADDPPKYPPVRAGEHLLAKFLGGRTHTPADAVSTVGDRVATTWT